MFDPGKPDGTNDTLKIGITFNERIMQDLPTESHDISMDYVFTNDKYYKSEI